MSSRLIGYGRVSLGSQNVDAQVDALRSVGCQVVYADEGVSGATTSRPQLDRCHADLQRGDVLVVARLDRLGRSAAHLASTVEALAERGVGFRSLHEFIHTTTAAGRLILGIFAALAAFERDLKPARNGVRNGVSGG